MIAAYRWDSNWKILLLVVIMLPLLLRLGFWQLQRGEEKQLLQQQYQQQGEQAPVALSAVDIEALVASSEPLYQRVRFTGRFDNQRLVLLDNRIYNGVVGYEVLAPFTTNAGQTLLVNRGWIEGSPDRRQLPLVPAVTGEVELLGKLHVPLGQPVLLANDKWSDQWPLVVQWEDMQRLSTVLGMDLLPYSVRLEPTSSTALIIDWAPINTRPEKHWGYAVQWFLMAAVLTLFWLYSSIRRAEKP